MSKKAAPSTIGILINNLDKDYQKEFWRGVDTEARIRNLNILFIGGSTLDSPNDFDYNKAEIFNYLDSRSLDGVISLSSSIGSRIGHQETLNRIHSWLGDTPHITIGPENDICPAANVDNKQGIKELVAHLVLEHGKKRILFMGTSDSNFDGYQRKQAFLEALAEFNIDPLEGGILKGEFNPNLAAEVLDKWLNKKIPFDALISANDQMAFSCFQLLQKRGYAVPEEISLCGFDDFHSARFFDVPLSTVKQPIYEIGRWSVSSMDKLLHNEQVPSFTWFKGTSVIRKSCGCQSKAVQLSRWTTSESRLLKEIREIPETIQTRLTSEFIQSITEESPDRFLHSFQTCLQNGQLSENYNEWEHLISLLRTRLYSEKNRTLSLERRSICEDTLHQARLLIKEKEELDYANHFIKFNNQVRQIQFSISETISTFSLQNFLIEITENLKMMEIYSCFISLLESEEDHSQSRLIYAYHQDHNIELPDSGILFATSQLFPRDILLNTGLYNFYIETLYHGDTQLGLIVLGMNPNSGIIGTSLTSLIRSSFRSSMLIDQLTLQEKALNEMYSQLKIRADEVERANRQIQKDQAHLLAAEKMASLGRLTAGIAHEMNTPLAAVRASISELTSLVHEYKNSIGDPEVDIQDHKDIAAEMLKSLELAAIASEKGATFIQSIKNQTRDRDINRRKTYFNPMTSINESITLLGHRLRHEHCRVHLSSEVEKIQLKGNPGKFSQIITNLLTNAIEAMEPDGGIISINLTLKEALEIRIYDQGRGIPEEIVNKIFDPLFTTRAFGEGTGLGLTICYDIVNGDFNGNITVENSSPKGSCFLITLPDYKKEA